MSKIIFIFFFLVPFLSHAQVGIGTNTPATGAVLDINSQIATNQYGGLKLPTLNLTQRNSISTPIPDGLMIYYTEGSTRCVQVYDGSASSWVNMYCMNAVPEATSVMISGTYEVGETLTGSYTYSDAESDVEGATTVQWYRADDAAGTNAVAISGATSSTYTLVPADAGFYIAFEVIPVATTGASPGMASISSYTLVSYADVAVSFNQQSQSIAENAVNDDIQLSFDLSNNPYGDITVTITASDYSRLDETTAAVVTIPSNSASPFTTTVAPFNVDDNLLIDGNATVTFTITAVSIAVGTTSIGTPTTDTVDIADDDGVTPYVLADWDFNGNTGSEATVNASNTGVNITGAVISRGSGINAANNGNRFNANSFTQPNLTSAIANDDYFEFSVTPNTDVTITEVEFLYQRSGTGPSVGTLRSSVDGFTTDLASFPTLNSGSTNNVPISTINAVAGTVTFRLYLYGNTNAGGSGGFEGTGADLTITGVAN